VLQVLTNLLTNALRYTPEAGRVVASVGVGGAGELGSRGAGGTGEGGVARLLVSVRDTGVGIAAEELGRVFERFYRVDRSRSRALGGSGIGLTIARALVEAMGGQIWAESAGMGRGATFHFTLPVAP
jgi:histidine kinase